MEGISFSSSRDLFEAFEATIDFDEFPEMRRD